MLKTPDSLITEPELNIPPALVLQPDKPKRKFPLWLIVSLGIGIVLSLGTTAYLFIMQKPEPEDTPVQRRTVIVTATPSPAQVAEVTLSEQPLLSVTPRVLPTIYQGNYQNPELMYTLQYPLEWTKSSEGIYVIYEGSGGKMFIGQETQTDLDIETWFDSTYAEEEGAPVKGILFMNRNKVQILESRVQDERGPLRYFFITPTKTVVSISFTAGNNDQANRALQTIYGNILESISPLPAEQ